MTPFVSVIIPHRNDSEKLRLCIEALNNQTYPRDKYEIIVIDNGSENIHKQRLIEINNDHNITLFNEPKLSSYAARNLGIENAKGDFYGFTDADCIPELDWIENAIKEFKNNSQYQIIGGKIDLFFRVQNNPNTVELYEKIHSFRQDHFIKADIRCNTPNKW